MYKKIVIFFLFFSFFGLNNSFATSYPSCVDLLTNGSSYQQLEGLIISTGDRYTKISIKKIKFFLEHLNNIKDLESKIKTLYIVHSSNDKTVDVKNELEEMQTDVSNSFESLSSESKILYITLKQFLSRQLTDAEGEWLLSEARAYNHQSFSHSFYHVRFFNAFLSRYGLSNNGLYGNVLKVVVPKFLELGVYDLFLVAAMINKHKIKVSVVTRDLLALGAELNKSKLPPVRIPGAIYSLTNGGSYSIDRKLFDYFFSTYIESNTPKSDYKSLQNFLNNIVNTRFALTVEQSKLLQKVISGHLKISKTQDLDLVRSVSHFYHNQWSPAFILKLKQYFGDIRDLTSVERIAVYFAFHRLGEHKFISKHILEFGDIEGVLLTPEHSKALNQWAAIYAYMTRVLNLPVGAAPPRGHSHMTYGQVSKTEQKVLRFIEKGLGRDLVKAIIEDNTGYELDGFDPVEMVNYEVDGAPYHFFILSSGEIVLRITDLYRDQILNTYGITVKRYDSSGKVYYTSKPQQ